MKRKRKQRGRKAEEKSTSREITDRNVMQRRRLTIIQTNWA